MTDHFGISVGLTGTAAQLFSSVIGVLSILLLICSLAGGCADPRQIPSSADWELAKEKLLESVDDFEIFDFWHSHGYESTVDFWATADELFLTIISNRSDSHTVYVVFVGEARGQELFRTLVTPPAVHILDSDSSSIYNRLIDTDSIWSLLGARDDRISKRDLRHILDARTGTADNPYVHYRIVPLRKKERNPIPSLSEIWEHDLHLLADTVFASGVIGDQVRPKSQVSVDWFVRDDPLFAALMSRRDSVTGVYRIVVGVHRHTHLSYRFADELTTVLDREGLRMYERLLEVDSLWLLAGPHEMWETEDGVRRFLEEVAERALGGSDEAKVRMLRVRE